MTALRIEDPRNHNPQKEKGSICNVQAILQSNKAGLLLYDIHCFIQVKSR